MSYLSEVVKLVGSTVRQEAGSVLRYVRVDDEGRLVVGSGGLVQDVNIVEVAGNPVVESAPGVLGVGGTQAPETAVWNGSFPVQVGAVIRRVLNAITDGHTTNFLSDTRGRLHVRPAGYDELTDAQRVASLNPDSTAYYPAGPDPFTVLVSDTNLPADTYDYYVPMGRYNTALIPFDISGGVTLTLFFLADNDILGVGREQDITHLAQLVSTGFSGQASYTDTADALRLRWNGPGFYVRLVTADGTNAEEVYVFRKYADEEAGGGSGGGLPLPSRETLQVSLVDQAAGTYYYPSAAGQAIDRFNALSVRFETEDATLTVENFVVTAWGDITPSGYSLTDDSTGFASFISAAGSPLTKTVDFDDFNSPLWRIKVVLPNATNTVRISTRENYM